MSSFEVRGLDEYTNKMIKRLTSEYPHIAENFLKDACDVFVVMDIDTKEKLIANQYAIKLYVC